MKCLQTSECLCFGPPHCSVLGCHTPPHWEHRSSSAVGRVHRANAALCKEISAACLRRILEVSKKHDGAFELQSGRSIDVLPSRVVQATLSLSSAIERNINTVFINTLRRQSCDDETSVDTTSSMTSTSQSLP